MLMIENTNIRVVETGINQVVADVDDLIDQFILSDYALVDPDLSEIVRNAKPSHIFEARRHYRELVQEIETFTEGYEHLNEEQKSDYVAFLCRIIDSLQNTRKKATRKVRKAKPKSPDQIVKGIKYLKKDEALKVESIEPTRIVGATSLWTFNNKLSRLTKYVSQEGATLSLKGTTILNMDETKSVSKTLRKPEVDLPIFASDAKKMIEAKFEKIKAKPKVPNGRINKDTLLIRAFK